MWSSVCARVIGVDTDDGMMALADGRASSGVMWAMLPFQAIRQSACAHMAASTRPTGSVTENAVMPAGGEMRLVRASLRA